MRATTLLSAVACTAVPALPSPAPKAWCLQRLFDRTSAFWVDDEVHGPPDARRYSCLPTFILRG